MSFVASRAPFRVARRHFCEVLRAPYESLRAGVIGAEDTSAAVQFQANSKANHLGTYPGDASHANPNGAATAAGAGAGAGAGAAGLAGRMPSFKNKVAPLLKLCVRTSCDWLRTCGVPAEDRVTSSIEPPSQESSKSCEFEKQPSVMVY